MIGHHLFERVPVTFVPRYHSDQNDGLHNSEGIRSVTAKTTYFKWENLMRKSATVNACMIETAVLSECSSLYFLFVVVCALMVFLHMSRLQLVCFSFTIEAQMSTSFSSSPQCQMCFQSNSCLAAHTEGKALVDEVAERRLSQK